jgi:hypothetical protein
MSALVLHLGLETPSKDAQPKEENVLIWGGASSIGFYAVQIAAQVCLVLSPLLSQIKFEVILLTYLGGI